MMDIKANKAALLKVPAPDVGINRDSLLLPVPDKYFSLGKDHLSIDGVEYDKKAEFHITLLNRANWAKVIQADGGNGLVLSAVRELIQQTDWSFRRLGKFALLHESKPGLGEAMPIEARSVIEFVEMPAALNFYSRLSKIIDSEVAAPPLHLTLYTNNHKKGIGVSSESELSKFKVRDLQSI